MTEENSIETFGVPELGDVYFNEFGIGIAKNDVVIMLQRNGKPQALLNASYITAKAFARALEEAIIGFEKKTNHTILTSDEVEKAMNKDEELNNS